MKPALHILLLLTVMLCGSLAVDAQTRRRPPSRNHEELINGLLKVGGVFGDDGMYIFFEDPEIQRLLNLKARAIPLLIAHLDDTRTLPVTPFTSTRRSYPITIGAACYDILTLIIRPDARFFHKKCLKQLEEGTAGSCARQRYTIFPWDFWRGEKLRVKPSVGRAKQNWLAAYRNGQIHYEGAD
jgi:hypothetical protein